MDDGTGSAKDHRLVFVVEGVSLVTHDIRWKQRFDNFQRALHRLTLAVKLQEQRPLSDLEQQGLIQGFEFTHELAWNVLKDYLEMEGIQGLIGSRSTVREVLYYMTGTLYLTSILT